MPHLYIFRLKAFRSKNIIKIKNISKKDYVIKIITSHPSHEIRKGYVWRIGNDKIVDDIGIVFAVGRTTVANKELYDVDKKNFTESYGEDSSFTYAFYDFKTEVLGIIQKTKLCPTARGIANNLQKLLNADALTKEYHIRVEISEIPDPESFIEQIHNAYAVTEFTMGFSEPNPFDPEKLFHKPMENLLREASGLDGKTIIYGEELDKDVIEELARSAASTGNTASAKIRKERDHKPVSRYMKGNFVNFLVQDVDIIEAGQYIFSKINQTYRGIRGTKGND
jgi:hypothetical protein